MNWFSRLSLQTKVVGLVAVAMLASIGGLLVVFALSMGQLAATSEQIISQRVLAQVEEQLKSSVQAMVSSVEARLKAEAANKPEAEVLALVRREFDPARYGEAGYFFAYTYDGVRVVAPENQAQVGKNMWDVTGKKNNKVVQNVIGAARSGGGFFTYVWVNPKSQQQEDKLSYAVPLKIGSVDLAVGTGTYLPMLAQARQQLNAHIATTRAQLLWS